MDALLPRDSLVGVRVALSVSESPDLTRLGMTEAHLRLAVGEVVRAVLVGGGKLAYGGHLEPTGYTAFLAGELQRYGKRKDRPLVVCLAWQEHRRLKLSQLEARSAALGLFGEIVCLDPGGNKVRPGDGRGEDPVPVDDDEMKRKALTGLRRYMRGETKGCVVMGGKRHGFQGALPGLMEEVLIALERPEPQPVYLAGGFGGVSADIIKALGVDDLAWLPADADAPPDDPRLIDGCERLAALRRSVGWRTPDNGLSADENSRLAATHRPSEIAALVSLGLGRKFAGMT